MNTNPISPKEKKLRNLRTILWVVFGGVTLTVVLVGILSIPLATLIKTPGLSIPAGLNTGMLLLTWFILMLIKVAVSGTICLVIYHIFKYRLDKDEDLFL
ncbi:MAG: hypothetical protein ABSB41_07085 [Anaerolineales bacterium]|jgi:uncharacterized membrane protein